MHERTPELTDFILRLDAALDLDLGNALIDEFATPQTLRPSRIGDGELDPTVRSSSQVNVSRCARERGSARARRLSRQLQNCIHDWITAYVDHVDGVVLDSYTAPSLVRYDVGDFFGLHHDANTLTFRTVSAVALLPSDFDGGELTFFARRLPAGLTAGDVVLFPSNFLFSHAVSPVTRGVRYSIVTWMR